VGLEAGSSECVERVFSEKGRRTVEREKGRVEVWLEVEGCK
jgi:hypothetical protein